jgi:nucleoside-diphosphate-sugar epimerase
METDIRDATRLRAMNGCDVIFHLAAIPPGAAKRHEYYEINVRGTENVLALAHSSGVRRVIYVSSAEVYGILPSIPCPEDVPLRPFTEYGRSKGLAEAQCFRFMREKQMEVVVLRPGSVVGPGVEFRSILFVFNQIINDRPLFLLGKGKNKIQLLSVHDLVDVLVLALESPFPNGPLNVAGRGATALIDLGQKLKRHARSESRIIAMPSLPLKPLLGFMEALGLWPSLLPYITRSDRDFVLDITRARKILGFEPHYGNVEALNEAFDWYQKGLVKMG